MRTIAISGGWEEKVGLGRQVMENESETSVNLRRSLRVNWFMDLDE